MSDSTPNVIRLKGLRQNNLKNFDLDLPLRRLVVITGLSGSGKSSLAFDTLFAEGQRRYIETFSPYARQFLDRMDKPQADHIEGIPPAIAVEQRNSVKSTRSTVGTMTEITDYTKIFWPLLARLYCRQCGQLVQKDPPQKIWEIVRAEFTGNVLVTFQLALSEKFSLEESFQLIARQGYQRLLLNDKIISLPDAVAALVTTRQIEAAPPKEVTVIQDRLAVTDKSRARFVEACEQAYHFGSGRLAIRLEATPATVKLFSNKFHCAACDLVYREPVPSLFSFNHPTGACPACKGFGRIIAIDYDAAIPDKTKTIAGGVVKPWQTGQGAECQDDMMKFAKKRKAPINVPFADLPKKWQDWVVEGDPGYGQDEAHKWPRCWYGVKGYFRWLESKSYKMHVRVLLSRYRKYEICPQCHGARFQPEALLHKIGGPKGLTIADFYGLSVTRALPFLDELLVGRARQKNDPINLSLQEVRSRLGYLDEVGLGYLTLDRATKTLSGGETERVNLTTCLSSRLVNTLFVLDEPSVGLHARDTERLIQILHRLRDAGNTVVVVEHEASVMRAADQIIDLGPGHGEAGGHLVFQGPLKKLLASKVSLTGQYLSGRKRIEIPTPRPVPSSAELVLEHARAHNLADLTVRIPLGRFVCLTGVSGSGKTTLLRDELLPALMSKMRQNESDAPVTDEAEEENPSSTFRPPSSSLRGAEALGQVVFVDQSSLGKTPRSNPAVYIGAFDDIRQFFAASETAQQRGFSDSSFSFNSAQGQCERCRGAGFEKIEMQFLSDIFIRCPECKGRRYRPHILEVKIKPPGSPAWSIADFLEATVDEAVVFLGHFPDSKPARRAITSLKLLQEVGLGYLRVGQPINTLSGGESQRLKLVGHLAEVNVQADQKPILFLFDEPTTGLHFEDVRVLLKVFQRLVDSGHSVLVIEHNLDVIKCADWIIDLGPEAGEGGGRIVAEGTPNNVVSSKESHTGASLLKVM